MQRGHGEKWPRPAGLALPWAHTVLRIAYLDWPNRALRALSGCIAKPALGIRIVSTGAKHPDAVTKLQKRAPPALSKVGYPPGVTPSLHVSAICESVDHPKKDVPPRAARRLD